MIPLAYVIREDDDVSANAPPLANVPALLGGGSYPYSAEHGSVEDELVARGSHTHPLFRNDNAQVYHYMEEATRGTIYAASIKPSQRTKNGRKAWRALVAQYVGKDKWEKELKAMTLSTRGSGQERKTTPWKSSLVNIVALMCRCASVPNM